MNRRDLFRRALAGAGALTANAQSAKRAGALAQAPAPAWKPGLFDAHQNATVIAIADLIIPATDTPGAKDARVNEYIDIILAEGGPERRAAFIDGLGWLDGLAARRHQKPFVACSKTVQIALLKQVDGAAAEDLKPGANFFGLMKQLTVEAYYTSKSGIDELNKGGRIPSGFGCTQGDH
jgi:hypothetical protein